MPAVGSDQSYSVDTGRLRSAIQQAAREHSISIRDDHIVTGLVTGAALSKAFGNETSGRPIPAPEPSCYVEVYSLLNSRPFHTVDQPDDELTVHMVARANIYLQMKAENVTVKTHRLGGRPGSTSTLQMDKPVTTESPRHITRRELVDLGCRHSSITKQLIEKILQDGDFEVFKRIGIKATGCLHRSSRTSPLDASELIKSMTTWTYKMVRTRFDRLQSEGLIEARKTADNAALEYLIPEELGNGRFLFAHLPDPEEVKAIYKSA